MKVRSLLLAPLSGNIYIRRRSAACLNPKTLYRKTVFSSDRSRKAAVILFGLEALFTKISRAHCSAASCLRHHWSAVCSCCPTAIKPEVEFKDR